MRFLLACSVWLLLTASAGASTILEQVKMLQRTERQVSAAMLSGDDFALRRLDAAFSQQLQALLASDASFECKMAGNAMQGLLVSALLPPSARKSQALNHDAAEWARNMGKCEWELHLPSKRLITP